MYYSINKATFSRTEFNNIKINYRIGERRKGDVVIAFADVSKILKNVGWECKFSVEDALKSSWMWEKNLKNE